MEYTEVILQLDDRDLRTVERFLDSEHGCGIEDPEAGAAPVESLRELQELRVKLEQET